MAAVGERDAMTPTRTPDVLDADARRLRGIAADLDLGVNTTDPGQYERLLPLATSGVRLG